jgi:hypothetical protein
MAMVTTTIRESPAAMPVAPPPEGVTALDFDDPFAAVTKAKALLDQHAITPAAYEAVIARAAATLTAKMQYAAMMPEDEDYG